jgi:hypothetical protein
MATSPASEFSSLHHHLRYNHYPPIIDGERFAAAAIQAAREGRADEPVHDPESSRHAPKAWDVIEAWHLDFYLAEDDEDGEL